MSEAAALSDGSWTAKDRDEAGYLGLKTWNAAEAEGKAEEWLAGRPRCREIRQRCVMFRKIIDVVATAPECDRILFLDTDVFVAAPTSLPINGPDMIYMLDDTSGYGGSWRAPLSRPMVCALNAGFLYYSPGICDPDFMEWLAGKFLVGAKRSWLFEQTAWALLAGRGASHGRFNGHDARLFAGYQKRTAQEIREGAFKWFPRSKLTADHAYIESVVRGAKVIHFAGASRRWFEKFADLAEEEPARDGATPLRWEPTFAASGTERWLLAVRMALSELGK